MPRYEYVCEDCKEVQEKDHKMNDLNEEPCEKCKAPPEKLKKQLSPIGQHGSWSRWRSME